jgi:uncharacterized linocin/CFP29 family protein
MINRFGDLRLSGAPTHFQTLAAMLARNLSVGQLRSLTPLPAEAQKEIDKAVVRVGRTRLVLVDDLISEGLVYNLTDPLSVMQLEWESTSETGGAQRTMSPSARGENQLPNRTPSRVPIFLTTDDFFLGIRTFRASQRVGQPLDTTLVEQATRRVNEAIEDQAFNGASLAVGGYSAPGVLGAPSVNSYVYNDSGQAWDNAGKTGEEILSDVLSMIDLAVGDKRYGPYNLYVPTLYGNKLNADFKANSAMTTLQRLEQISVGGRNLQVRVADALPANKTVLVQMTSDVIDLINGQAPVTIPWTSPDGFTLYWLVMAIQVVRVRADYSSNSGIVVGFTS